MLKFHISIKVNHKVNSHSHMTLPSIAMRTFVTRHSKKQIPLIKSGAMQSNIRESYHGGNTEVYRPKGENLYYYDVNSLYPFASLNPMPGLNVVHGKFNDSKLEDLFGFFHCEITTNHQSLGLLPSQIKGLISPEGKFDGWYFSESLKFAAENGYKIKILEGYKFDQVHKVFDSYVNTLYKMKADKEVDPTQRFITKLLLNGLIGRIGMKPDPLQMDLVLKDSPQYQKINASLKIVKHIDLG